MKNIIILFLILGIITCSFLFSPFFQFRANRTEKTVTNMAFSLITKWQVKLIENTPFTYDSFSSIFSSKDAVHEINFYEEKIREFYGISHENKISAIGELMKIQKNNFLLQISVDEFFPVTKYTQKKRYWHWLYGVLIPIKKGKHNDYAFLKLGYDCRIEIEGSFIGQNSFISLLEINEEGRILNSNVEKKFLEQMRKFK